MTLTLLSVFAGVWLRLWHLDTESLWLDEIFSVWVSRRPWPTFWSYVRLENHPPLYYLLLRVWLRLILGPINAAQLNVDTVARTMSVLCTVSLIVVAAITAWRLRGPQCGALAALVFTVLPPLVRYGQEARMYAPLSLFSGVAIAGSLLYFHRGSRRSLILYVLGMILALYTHYYATFLWAAIFLGILLEHLAAAKNKLSPLTQDPSRDWWIANALVLVLFLPWLNVLRMQWRVNADTHWLLTQPLPSPVAAWDFLLWCLGWFEGSSGWSRWAGYSHQLPLFCFFLTLIFVGLPLWTITYSLRGITDQMPSEAECIPENNPVTPLLVISSVLPVFIALAISQYKMIWQFKYLLGVVPAFAGLIVALLWRLRRHRALLVVVGGMLLGNAFAASLADVGTMRPYNQEQWREAAATLRKELRNGDRVVVPEPTTLPPFWICLEHYGVPQGTLLGVHAELNRTEDATRLKQAINTCHASGGHVYLVTRFGLSGEVPEALKKAGLHETARRAFTAIDIATYSFSPSGH